MKIFTKVLSAFIGITSLASSFAADAVKDQVQENPPEVTNLYKQISPKDIEGNIIKMVGDGWMLITAGNKEKFNSMTASWGGMGVFNTPVTFILVHSKRYTYEFLEREDYYTLSFYDEKYRPVLKNIFGTKSGRDTDKVKESGFTPLFMAHGIAYTEAKMIIVCKKRFAANTQPQGDCHKLYMGDIVSVWVKK